ncbi:MAG TPA: SRPBCC domain-containing protein, partial [Candidatus Krumholzibacteria bacterium]
FLLMTASIAFAEVKTVPVNGFSFTLPVVLPGTPAEIFDAATGDISGWWDHTFSKNPKSFVLEPKAGGHFVELFDDQGNGVQHATVIYCERPKTIRFEGPLGLSGNAVQMVHTYSFEAVGDDSTRLTLTVNGQGAIDPATAGIVESVWKHFLVERFKPYVEAGKHKAKK